MKRNITCIECPVGCRILVDIKNGKVVKISGHKCPKGEEYSIAEIENPTRILTSTVKTRNLSLKYIPVRTDAPIPKGKILEVMGIIKNTVVEEPVRAGEIIVKGILGLKVNLVATRNLP